MRQFVTLIALCLALCASAQPSPSFTPFTVTSVHDGDTFTATDANGNSYRVRPIGYDAPEVRSNVILETQPYGRISGDTLRKLIKGKTVLLDTTALKSGPNRDKYGRLLAEAYFSDSTSIALFMVKNGLAWSWEVKGRTFPKMNTIIRDAHRNARNEVYGLWAGYLDEKGRKKGPIAPWTHRKKYGLNE